MKNLKTTSLKILFGKLQLMFVYLRTKTVKGIKIQTKFFPQEIQKLFTS